MAIEHFSCGYGDSTVIKGMNATFGRGEITALVADSGMGKSTLLKAINRLHEVEENGFYKTGTIRAVLDGEERDIYTQDPSYIRRKIGYIFQSPTPLPLSIEKNVSFGLDIMGIKESPKIEQALKDAYLWDEVRQRLDAPASSLSLGQQQRLAIARALVLDPEILLFDEPTSALDQHATAKIEQLMSELKRERTIILVTHDRVQVERIADSVVGINPDYS